MNVEFSDKRKDSSNYLSDLCDTFSTKDLISGKNWVKSIYGRSIDVILTNRSRCLFSQEGVVISQGVVIETGLILVPLKLVTNS